MTQLLSSLAIGLLGGWLAKAIHVKANQTNIVDKTLGLKPGATAQHLNAISEAAVSTVAQKELQNLSGVK